MGDLVLNVNKVEDFQDPEVWITHFIVLDVEELTIFFLLVAFLFVALNAMERGIKLSLAQIVDL